MSAMTAISDLQDPILVVGAGPAGLMAAGQVAERGARVVVLEKMARPARKLRITGKGRCNLTNTAEIQDWLARFGPSGSFLRSSFARFFNTELMDFFESLGVSLEVERGGRVFPKSGQATEVVDSLVKWVKRLGVELWTNRTVVSLQIEQNRVTGVTFKATEGEADRGQQLEHVATRKVIVTTGGATYPATGSTGDGFALARAVGHRIEPIGPALVPLKIEPDLLSQLEGLHLKNVRVTVLVNESPGEALLGDMEFISSGASGPVVLTLSTDASQTLAAGQNVELSLDLKPGLHEAKLDQRLVRDFRDRGKEELHAVLGGLLPRQLIPVCLARTGLVAKKPANQITVSERARLRTWLKDFRIVVTGTGSMHEALVTAGGVDTREVNPRTMESRLVSGLFFAGEVLDLCADTGGFNLQAAFSTGWMAGRAAVDRGQRSEDS